MNIKELIEKYKRYEGKWNSKTGELARQIFLEDLKQLDEPQPVKVPQYVADWIEVCKTFKHFVVSLSFALQPIAWEKNNLSDKCINWLMDANNQELFARAWLDGYEVEEEKRYLVKMLKANFGGKIQILSFRKNSFFWSSNWEGYKVHHTHKELEEAGFGWVFDCPGIEIEEVDLCH